MYNNFHVAAQPPIRESTRDDEDFITKMSHRYQASNDIDNRIE